MKIVHIETEKRVLKPKKEREMNCVGYKLLASNYKTVPLKEPIYIVEMSAKEIQLVSFYLELENRKPIVNMKLDVEMTKEVLKE